jgi:hypothetical protein
MCLVVFNSKFHVWTLLTFSVQCSRDSSVTQMLERRAYP